MHNVFISYSHKDKQWLERLQRTLKPFLRNNPISVWDDTKIHAGEQWKEEIEKELNKADIAVMLVSQNFLASDFVTGQEIPQLLKAAKSRGMKIIWVPISYCMFGETELPAYQATHDPQEPLESMTKWKQEKALVEIGEQIKKALLTRIAEPKVRIRPAKDFYFKKVLRVLTIIVLTGITALAGIWIIPQMLTQDVQPQETIKPLLYVKILADNIYVPYNGTTTIRWSSINATSCLGYGGTNGWDGSRGLSGSFATGNLTNTATYYISCSNAVGYASDSVTVTVGALNPFPTK
ncbi:MAG: toll/interleukin-1 receptor domain-containing protein [Bacteroidetes bacterium]|nr:toll/interleukin-1 receptor domain-containing protein [Bacteroidota bacterium]MCW5897188.1 toll/interleukin-1 receptor domain-containing protein [Bacteroidota bacterium]